MGFLGYAEFGSAEASPRTPQPWTLDRRQPAMARQPPTPFTPDTPVEALQGMSFQCLRLALGNLRSFARFVFFAPRRIGRNRAQKL